MTKRWLFVLGVTALAAGGCDDGGDDGGGATGGAAGGAPGGAAGGAPGGAAGGAMGGAAGGAGGAGGSMGGAGGSMGGAPPAPQPPYFDSPQAVAWVGDRLVVSNVAVDDATFAYGEGFVTVIDPAAGEVVNKIPTTQRNPQTLVVDGDALYVVNTGVLDFSDFSQTEPGGVDRIPVADLDHAVAPAANVEIDGPAIAGPVGLAFLGPIGIVSMSAANVYLVLEPATLTFRRGPDDPVAYDGTGEDAVSLGTLAAGDERAYLLDFNRDRLYVIDGDGEPWPCSVDLGDVPGELEGAQLPAIVGDRLFYLLGVAGAVKALDLTTLERRDAGDCAADPPATVVGALGQAPNDLDVRDGRIYVVHSMDNNAKAYAVDDGNEVDTWALDPGSNPWHLAISPDGRWMAVTEWQADAVTLFDLEGGAPVRIEAR